MRKIKRDEGDQNPGKCGCFAGEFLSEEVLLSLTKSIFYCSQFFTASWDMTIFTV